MSQWDNLGRDSVSPADDAEGRAEMWPRFSPGIESSWYRTDAGGADSNEARCLRLEHTNDFAEEVGQEGSALLAELTKIDSADGRFIIQMIDDETLLSRNGNNRTELRWREKTIGYVSLVQEEVLVKATNHSELEALQRAVAPEGPLALTSEIMIDNTVLKVGWTLVNGSKLSMDNPRQSLERISKPPATFTFTWFRRLRIFLTQRMLIVTRLPQLSERKLLSFQPKNHNLIEVPLLLSITSKDIILYTLGSRLRLFMNSEETGGRYGREATVDSVTEHGDYSVHLDGDPLEVRLRFDPQPFNHTPAGVYRYKKDQEIMLFCQFPTPEDSGQWWDAKVVQVVHGNRHEVQILGYNKKLFADLNTCNHSPLWLKVERYDEVARIYENDLISRHASVVDAITGRRFDVSDHLVKPVLGWTCQEDEEYAAINGYDGDAYEELLTVLEWSERRFHGVHPNPCFVVTGGPACGKSCLAKRLAMLCIKTGHDLLPIFISASDWAKIILQNEKRPRGDLLDKYLKAKYDENTELYTLLKQALYSRRVVLLVDEIDDVGDFRAPVERFLCRLGRAGHRIVLFSRPGGYQKELFLNNNFSVLRICPFQWSQQQQLAHARLSKDLAELFLGALENYEELAGSAMAYNMLLCIAEDSNKPLESAGSSTFSVYECVMDAMLQHVFPDSFEQVRELLQVLGLAMHSKKIREFSTGDVKKGLQSAEASELTQVWDIVLNAVTQGNFHAVEMCWGPPGEKQKFRFAHRSFQEYFAARYVGNCRQTGKECPLIPSPDEKLFDEFWREFLVFYFQHLDQLGSKHKLVYAGAVDNEKAYVLAMFLQTSQAIITLDLAEARIHSDASHHLSEALSHNQTLTTMNLSGNYLNGDGARSLSHALKWNCSLTELDLQKNYLLSECTHLLSEGLMANTSLLHLNIGENYVGSQGSGHLGEALKKNQSLTTLEVHGNDIGDAGARHLSEALKVNNVLRCLRMQYNSIGPPGARSLSQAFRRNANASLKEMDLSGNGITDEGIKNLADALKTNTSLQILGIQGCHVGDLGAHHIAELLKKNNTIKKISMRANFLADSGQRHLSGSLAPQVNTALQSLNLAGNRLSPEAVDALREAWGAEEASRADSELDLENQRPGTKAPASAGYALPVPPEETMNNPLIPEYTDVASATSSLPPNAHQPPMLT